MDTYSVQSPVLMLVFNRPDTTLQVLNKIKEAKPKVLYVAADGPRANVENDKRLCDETRKIFEHIDWECKVHKLFNEENKGCKTAVADAITWFFEQEEEGIILEDDCLPADDFFYFCDQMLAKYRHDTRIMSIAGANFQKGRKWGGGSYYFSGHSQIWGWASWRRTWQLYDRDLTQYKLVEVEKEIKNVFSDPFLIESWMNIFRDLKTGRIDTWDYQFNLITYFNNGLCVTPNVNLISNTGYRPDATHTRDIRTDRANLATGQLEKPLIHPAYFKPQKEADDMVNSEDFQLGERWRQFHKNQLPRRRFKRWLRGLFKFKERARKKILQNIAPFRDIEGWLSDNEALGLYQTAAKLAPNAKVVEIGSWQGKSTYCLAKGLPSGKVYAIDPFNADWGQDVDSKEEYIDRGSNKNMLKGFNERMTTLGVYNKIIVKKGYSYDFYNDTDFNNIDFLFIDGDHSIEGCKADYESYAPKIVKGGFIAFHDYYADRTQTGPTYVIDNIVIPSADFEFYKLEDSLWIGKKK